MCTLLIFSLEFFLHPLQPPFLQLKKPMLSVVSLLWCPKIVPSPRLEEKNRLCFPNPLSCSKYRSLQVSWQKRCVFHTAIRHHKPVADHPSYEHQLHTCHLLPKWVAHRHRSFFPTVFAVHRSRRSQIPDI